MSNACEEKTFAERGGKDALSNPLTLKYIIPLNRSSNSLYLVTVQPLFSVGGHFTPVNGPENHGDFGRLIRSALVGSFLAG